MSDAKTIRAEQLLSHGQALRSIVRSLIRDEHHAEDVVQESYAAALRGVPPGAQLGAWMRGTARKLSFRLARGEARRRRREEAAARRAGTVDEQTQLLSQVADEVHRMREPFRTVVMMRYWEGLPPRRIAAELGVPVNTVRSRLQTGLHELRVSLDDRNGDRRAWVVPLASLSGLRSGKIAGVAATVLGMCALVGGTVALAPGVLGGEEVPEWVADASPTPVVATGVADPADRKKPDPVRKIVSTPRVRGRCLAYGTRKPLPECRVRLVTEDPSVKPMKRTRGPWIRCREDGTFAIEVDRKPWSNDALEVACPGRATFVIDLVAGYPKQELGEILLPRGLKFSGTVREESGFPIANLRLRVGYEPRLLPADRGFPVPEELSAYEHHVYSLRTSTGFQAAPRRRGFARTDGGGHFELPGGWLEPSTLYEPTLKIANLENYRYVSHRHFVRGDTLHLDVVMRRPANLPRLTGTVTTADGTPVPGVKVVATSRDWSKVLGRTDSLGRFLLVKSLGTTDADHVMLAMPALVKGGYVTIDPDRSFSWGDRDVRLRAKRPVRIALHVDAGRLDLKRYRLQCSTFRDDSFSTCGSFFAKRGGPVSSQDGTYLVAQGISHLLLVPEATDGDTSPVYLGVHEIGLSGARLHLTVHRVRVQVNDSAAKPVPGVWLDCGGRVAGHESVPMFWTASSDLESGTLRRWRTGADGSCEILLGLPVEKFSLGLQRGRGLKVMQRFPATAGKRPVIVVL